MLPKKQRGEQREAVRVIVPKTAGADPYHPSREESRAFGKALRLARTRAQVTQGVLAKHIGYSQTSVGGWETGTNVPDQPRVVFEMERYLGVAPGSLSSYLGYEPTSSSRSGTIADDDDLTRENRAMLLRFYERLRKQPDIPEAGRQALMAVFESTIK